MTTILLFGANGGIGSATGILLANSGYDVVPITRKDVDFTELASDFLIRKLIKQHDPDVIINCAGYLTDNSDSIRTTMSINVESNWSILRYLHDREKIHLNTKPIRVILIGSSAYKEGKPQYVVYAASKAALHNMWQGAVKLFKDSNISIDMIHPVRTRTNMTIGRFSEELDYIDASDVADLIKFTIENERINTLNEMTFGE